MSVLAGLVVVSACLVATSQPRTSTSSTCWADVTSERSRSRSRPSITTSGSVLAGPPLLGAEAAWVGGPKENAPSRTATSKPVSRASRLSSCQSVCPAWLTCGNTVRVALTAPTLRPARWATLTAMSEAVIWT